jgi:Ca-activated chloride channel family protein
MWKIWIVLAALATVPAQAALREAPPLIHTIGGEKPVELASLSIRAAISGSMAETTVTMRFYNPNQRPLEGHLQFPLLDGQRVSAFALDIDGKMRPAVPVEKARGRQVFESIERQQVDPALLEVTEGNNFKLRVYPIAPSGTRTVELKYVETLSRDGANWAYRLPLAYGMKAGSFELTLSVQGGAGKPLASGAMGNIDFVPADAGFRAQIEKTSYVPSGMLALLLPAQAEQYTSVSQFNGETYFVTEIPVPAQRTARPLPAVVGLLWDSSGSGAQRALNAELAELDIYFKTIGNVEVRLTRLRDNPEPTETFRIKGGNWNALRRALEATVYDGASALGSWAAQVDVNEYLLFSDGLINYGPRRFPVLSKKQKLFAVNSASAADTERLAALATRNGGRLVQVSPQSPGAAAAALLTDGPIVQDLRGIGATALVVEPDGRSNGMIRVAGKLLQPAATVRLTLSQGGKLRELSFPVSAAAPQHPLAAQLWASFTLHGLDSDLHRAEIRRLGQQFGMPTRETSLIVLDRLEDYVRHDIAPPAEYLAAFDKLKAFRGMQVREQTTKHIDNIARALEQKAAWWERSFVQSLPPKPLQRPEEVLVRPQSPQMTVSASTNLTPRAEMLARPPAPAPAAAPLMVTGSRIATREVNDARAKMEPATSGVGVGIALKKWRSDAPYIARMTKASADTIYAIYLDEKPSYLNSSAFFLDAADLLFEKGKRDLALRVLSNLAEMDLENRQVLRILGYRLLQADAAALAIPVFEKVLQLAEDEPQSFRDLGLAYAAAQHHQQAIDQLYEVVIRPWARQFPEIELIALAEINALVAAAPAAKKIDTSRIDTRLLKNLPLDLRVVLSWDADNSDMDLWVTDPNGEKCFYQHRLTSQGGRLSGDATGGYGPEEFSLKNAKPGKYRIEANFYGNRQQTVAGATTLQVKLASHFGTASMREQSINMRLKDKGATVLVGEFEVKPK